MHVVSTEVELDAASSQDRGDPELVKKRRAQLDRRRRVSEMRLGGMKEQKEIAKALGVSATTGSTRCPTCNPTAATGSRRCGSARSSSEPRRSGSARNANGGRSDPGG